MQTTLASYMRLIRLLLLTLFTVPTVRIMAKGQDTPTDDPDVLEFAFITDIHQYGSSADVRMADDNVRAFVHYCNTTPSLQFALFGGDFYNAYDTDLAMGLQCLQQGAMGFRDLRIPFYATRGNHDCNAKWRTPDGRRDQSQIITDREYYNIVSPLSSSSPFHHPQDIVVDEHNPFGNYYFRDFPRQRVRLIVLNHYDRDSLEVDGYHGRQMRWLAETALNFDSKDDASDWCFIILGHAITINHSRNPITRLLHAYVNGQDFFDSDAGINYGLHYSQHRRAQFVAFLYGHYHEDIYTNWDGYNMISVTRGYATGSEVQFDPVSFDHFVLNTRTRTLEERRIGRGKSRYYTYDVPRQVQPGLSFPEADGMGHYTVGGRLGKVLHVTNLDDDGPGSLRMAISQPGARSVVFDVAGTIRLESPLIIDHDSLSVLGQSAPDGSIRLEGAPLVVRASEVTLRYFYAECIRDEEFGHHGLMIDHVTACADSTSAIAIRRTENVTVQCCRISSRSLTEPALLAGGFKATYMLNHVTSSPWAIGFSDCEGENRWIQVARNLVSSWQQYAMAGGCHQGEFTIHENYFEADSSVSHSAILTAAPDGTARYWMRHNCLQRGSDFGIDRRNMVEDRPGQAYRPQPADTLMRPYMPPVARPHDIVPAPSCLVISAFNFVYLFGEPTFHTIRQRVLRQAGCDYRPEPVSRDSLYTPGVLAYLDRIVQPERSIVILFDNDAHCQIDGYPYLAGQLAPTASDTAHLALVSCGDFLQGGLAGSITRGHAIIDVMRRLGYDAVALGTHDFDFDLGYTRQLLDELGVPAVCANLRNTQADTLVFASYVIRRYGRRNVAFVGVTTPSTQITNALSFDDESSHRIYDFDPHKTYQRVQQAADDARRNGADYVVVLSQLGATPDRFDISAPGLIATTSGIDAVLDGHSHDVIAHRTYPNRYGHPVAYVQGGQRFSHIGKLVIAPDGGILSELIPTQSMKFRDTQTALVVDSIKGCYIGSAEEYVGRSQIRLVKPKEHDYGMTEAINAGHLVTDAMRWYVDADIAWLNTGSIRNSLPAGEISRGDIREMIPYENELVTFDITGKSLLKVIGRMLYNLPLEGGHASPVSGLRIMLKPGKRGRFDVAQLYVYDRVTSRYLPVDPNRTYHIVTTDYCEYLSRRMHLRLLTQPHHTGQLYNEVVQYYISQQLHGVIEPTSQLLDERVIIQ